MTTIEGGEQQHPEIIPEPFFKKYALHIIVGLVVVLAGVIIYGAVHVSGKGIVNPIIVKRDTVSARYLLNDLGQIGQSVVIKDKVSDGSIVYEVPTGIDTVRDASGKVQMDTVKFQPSHPVMDTVKDAQNKAVMDTVFNGRQIVMDSASKKPKLTARLKFRTVPAVRVHLEFRNPKNVEEIPGINIHLLPPHP